MPGMETPRPSTRVRLPIPTQRHLEPVDVLGLVETLRGRHCVIVDATGKAHHDWIIWSEALGETDGWPSVHVVPEAAWWRWVHTSVPPREIPSWPAGAVWVEV